MRTRVYTVVLEIEDRSDSDGEDIELWIEDVLREGLPSSLEANIIEFTENDENI